MSGAPLENDVQSISDLHYREVYFKDTSKALHEQQRNTKYISYIVDSRVNYKIYRQISKKGNYFHWSFFLDCFNSSIHTDFEYKQLH